MLTPVTPDGEIDLKSLRRLVESCIGSDAVGIGAFGGVSEYSKISDYDREAILEAIVEQTAGRVPVFVGPAAMSMRSTRENVKQAVRLGGELLMVCSPIMGRMKRDALFDYYRAVADMSDLPIMVQDTGASKPTYSAELVAELYHEIDTVFSGKIEGIDFLLDVRDRITAIATDAVRIRAIRTQLNLHNEQLAEDPRTARLAELGEAASDDLRSVELALYNPDAKVNYDILAGRHGGAQLYSRLGWLYRSSMSHDGPPTQGMQEVNAELTRLYEQSKAELERIIDKDVGQLNSLAAELGVDYIIQ